MSHQVLARKWRPKRFDQLVGQEHVVRALSNALASGRLHHAYLFTGTRGVGKTTLARILAKCLNCTGGKSAGVTPEPCGECAACREIDSGRFVDLIEIDAASNTGIDNMREVIDNAQYAPTAGRYKVYIIDEVHMLSKNAFNAMLKTLEEPPGHVIFILATTDPQKVPVTVLSRCLQFNLKQMPPGHVAGHLKNVLEAENVPFEAGALALLARAAAGSMRDALSLTDQAIAYGSGEVKEDDTRAMLGVIDQAYLMPVLEAVASGDGPGLMNEAAELAARGFSFDAALQDLAGLLHQVALALSIPEAVSEDTPERERLFELAARLDPERVQVLYQIATLGRRDLEWAPDEYAGFSMTLLRMLAFAPSDTAPEARAAPPTPRPESRSEPRPAPAPVPTRPTAPPPPWDQAANETLPSPPGGGAGGEGAGPSDWRALAESLPGATRQLAMQCERLAHNGNTLRLRLPENQKTLLDNFGDKLQVALAEKLGAGLKVEFELTAAINQSPAAVRAREQAARQAEAEAAIRGDPLVQTLVRECDATVANIRPLAA
ncbi:MAG: DNA polymerase III subunit gamma/tau [Gallionellaceae bacterium]|nr:DNA polymerase III subunit gamma/tau [Gallionellaceae bacterium]